MSGGDGGDGTPRATVRRIDGRAVLDDPDALAFLRAVARHNCRATLRTQADRVAHFVRRMAERGDGPDDVVIVILAVDDPHGGPLADALMPGHDWQAYRDRGEAPFARGLAGRDGIEEAVRSFDPEAADALRAAAGPAVVVVDHGIAAVFAAAEAADAPQPGDGP